MAFLDRFRPKPDWQHADPLIRAAAARRLGTDDRALLETLFQGDPDPRVRRAALHRLADPRLAATVAADPDAGLREEAIHVLVATALGDRDPAAAEEATSALKDARTLTTVVREAALETVRMSALGRIEDPRLLATLARTSPHPGTRLRALERVSEPALLAEIAQKSEHKDVALGALERVTDTEALQAIAGRARHRSAARRAQARLDAQAAAIRAATPEDPELRRARDAEEARQDELLRRVDAEAAERAEARASRVALCETVEALDGTGEGALSRLEEARAAWAALGPLDGPQGAELDARFRRATEACESQHRAWTAVQAVRLQLEELITLAEPLAEAPDLADAARQWRELLQRWKALSPGTGVHPDLEERFARPGARVEQRQKDEREQQAREAEGNLARLRDLCVQLEALAAAPEMSLKDADRRLKEARKALDEPGPLPAKRDREVVLARLEAARKAVYPRFMASREDEEWKRWANASVQEELCARVEGLLPLKDETMEEAARQLQDIEARWKDAKQAPKEQGEALWQRFKAARDQVRAGTEAYHARKAAELAENAKRKEDLCVAAEALQDSTDWVKTAEALQKLQSDWKLVGPVARQHQSQALWARFRKACDHFFERRKADRDQRTEAWAGNLKLKEELCLRVEALADSTDWDKASADIRAAQAEWKKVGPVRKSQSDAIWQRFRAASDRFFERYKRRGEIEQAAQLEAREVLCREMEALMLPEGEVPSADLAEKVRGLWTAWRQGGADGPLGDRFLAARDRLLTSYPGSFAGTDLDPEANRAKMDKLCARVEAALAEAEGGNGNPADAEDLAARLKNALATNTMGGRAAIEARWQTAAAEVEGAQSAWKRLGPLPGQAGADLTERFREACRRFEERRPAPPAPVAAAPRRRERPRERPTRGA